MIANKKLIPSLGITLGVVGLTANALALTYCSGLSPLIMGGMIGSMSPLVGCVLAGALFLIGNNRDFFNKVYANTRSKAEIERKAEAFNEIGVYVPFIMAQAVVSFGIGAGLVALGLQSSVAIALISTIVAGAVCTVVKSLFSEKKQQPAPPTAVDSSEVDGVYARWEASLNY